MILVALKNLVPEKRLYVVFLFLYIHFFNGHLWVIKSVKTRGYKMIDAVGSQCFMIFVRGEILSEKDVLA